MAIIRSIPRNRRMPSLRGTMMVDTVRGMLRVRKWPKKRGTPRSASQRWWVDWFRQANLLAKYADGMTQARAIEETKGTGLYPRDIMLKAMRGRLYWWTDENGKNWYPMAAIQDISDTLDILAQAVGSVLVRAVDRWRPAGPASPAVGAALTYQGASLPPIWATAGAGVTVSKLPGTPITVDGTLSEYIFAVTTYASVTFVLDAIAFAIADRPDIRVSVDGGATYKAGASDYYASLLTATVMSSALDSRLKFAVATLTGVNNCIGKLTSLRAGRALFTADCAYGATSIGRRFTQLNFDGPITHVKLYSLNGNTFTTGTIRATGLVAA